MGQINRVPRGLLGLLDAKTGGRTPPETTGVLSPVIDLTPNYLADIPFEIAQASSPAAALTPGTNYGIVTVPAGELWYVYQVSAQIIANGAGDALDCFPVLVAPSGVVPVPLVNGTTSGFGSASANALENVPCGVTFAYPLLVGPGSRIATQTRTGGASTRTPVTSVIYRPVQV